MGKLWTYAKNTKEQIADIFINKKWNNSSLNCDAYSSFESVSSNYRIVEAKIRLCLRRNTARTTTTIHYDLSLLNNRDIRTKGVPLKLMDMFTNFGRIVLSIENDINTQLAKAWSAIEKLLVMWNSDLTDKIKRSFFQASVVSILLYGCTTLTQTKCMEKKLDGN